jgi:hypothetical protein
MERKLKLRYVDGSAVDRREVAFIKGKEEVTSLTDYEGLVHIIWEHDWVDKVEVEQIVVKRDWDLSGGWFSGPSNDLGELVIARPGEDRPDEEPSSFVDKAEDERGVRGLLFYHDGTLVYESFSVVVELGGGLTQRYSTEDKGGYCHANGEFFIATEEYERGEHVSKVFVNGTELPRFNFTRSRDGLYALVMPRVAGGGHGTQGGLITGKILNEDGSPADACKITAEVKSNSFLPFADGEQALTYSGKRGDFVLPFKGGTVLKRLYIDGLEPSRIVYGKPENEQEMPVRGVHAGAFGLRITRQKKAFFSLF